MILMISDGIISALEFQLETLKQFVLVDEILFPFTDGDELHYSVIICFPI